jgi:hypothetical protein
MKDIDDDIELSEKLCDYAKKMWNTKHDIKIEGYDVEVAIQDSEELQNSVRDGRMGGVYSLLHDQWIKKPQKVEFEPDEKLIRMKAETVMSSVDELNVEEEYAEFKEKIDKVWKKIKDFRKSGLESEGGEFSVGNLVFKLLRRNGYIQKVIEMKNKSYDKQFK